MKLRIRGNSVRIRLSQSEVAHLAAGKRIEQMTQFSSASSFVSSIETSSEATSPTATFDGLRMAVCLPPNQVSQWAESGLVSIEAVQSTGDGRNLQLLIEKDFECLHSRAEGDTDAFPNPRKNELGAVPMDR